MGDCWIHADATRQTCPMFPALSELTILMPEHPVPSRSHLPRRPMQRGWYASMPDGMPAVFIWVAVRSKLCCCAAGGVTHMYTPWADGCLSLTQQRSCTTTTLHQPMHGRTRLLPGCWIGPARRAQGRLRHRRPDYLVGCLPTRARRAARRAHGAPARAPVPPYRSSRSLTGPTSQHPSGPPALAPAPAVGSGWEVARRQQRVADTAAASTRQS